MLFPHPPSKKITSNEASVHVKLVGGRREAVGQSGKGRGAGQRDGQVRPGHGDRVVDVQIVQATCTTSQIINAMNENFRGHFEHEVGDRAVSLG